MSRIKVTEKEVFTFAELSSEAQQKALDNNRDFNTDHDWFDGVYDQQTELIKSAGFNLTKIYFSGFWSQGDGAMFEYSDITDNLKDEYIAQLDLSPMRKNWLTQWTEVWGSGSHRGHYYHKNCCSHSIEFETTFDFDGDNLEQFISDQFADFEDFVIERYRELAQNLYSALEKEFEYLSSDEIVKESLIANEYEFDSEGNFA